MSVIQLLHGSQTFKRASTKVNVFVMRADGTDKRDFPNKQLSQVKGTYNAVPAAIDGSKDNGTWYNSRYELKEGVMVMIMASTTYNGSPFSNGCMVLALREDAPLLKIDVLNTYNAKATQQRVPAFSGKADILGLDELEDYGIVLTRNFINNYFDEEEIEELLEVAILSTGSSKPSMLEVRTPSGSTRKVAVQQEGGRRIRIRRRNV